MAPHPVLIIYTSSSLTDSIMVTFVSPMPLRVTSAFERGKPRLTNNVEFKTLLGKDEKRTTVAQWFRLVQDGLFLFKRLLNRRHSKKKLLAPENILIPLPFNIYATEEV